MGVSILFFNIKILRVPPKMFRVLRARVEGEGILGYLGPSWGHLGPSWGHLGPSQEQQQQQQHWGGLRDGGVVGD